MFLRWRREEGEGSKVVLPRYPHSAAFAVSGESTESGRGHGREHNRWRREESEGSKVVLPRCPHSAAFALRRVDRKWFSGVHRNTGFSVRSKTSVFRFSLIFWFSDGQHHLLMLRNLFRISLESCSVFFQCRIVKAYFDFFEAHGMWSHCF